MNVEVITSHREQYAAMLRSLIEGPLTRSDLAASIGVKLETAGGWLQALSRAKLVVPVGVRSRAGPGVRETVWGWRG
jgi:hypothetical protein